MNDDRCKTCGELTHAAQEIRRKEQRENARKHPIYGTDFSKRNSVLIEEIRQEIARLRGKLSDISFAFPVWDERLDSPIGGMTCVLIALHNVKEEMHKIEVMQDDATPSPSVR